MKEYSHNQASDIVERDVAELPKIVEELILGQSIFAFDSDNDHRCIVIKLQLNDFCMVFESPNTFYTKIVTKFDLLRRIEDWE